MYCSCSCSTPSVAYSLVGYSCPPGAPELLIRSTRDHGLLQRCDEGVLKLDRRVHGVQRCVPGLFSLQCTFARYRSMHLPSR